MLFTACSLLHSMHQVRLHDFQQQSCNLQDVTFAGQALFVQAYLSLKLSKENTTAPTNRKLATEVVLEARRNWHFHVKENW